MSEQADMVLDFPKLEHRILAFWSKSNAFRKRAALNKGRTKWSFMDGPITANNPMGVHHAWGRTYKDLFQRYRAMRGYDQRYQNGFDCQGLWIEVEVEKELKFRSKGDIERYGIAEFVKRCKERALRFAALQVEQSVRLGYWMDWDDPKTLRQLADELKDPNEVTTIQGSKGPVAGTVEGLIGSLGSRETGGSYFTLSDENNYMIWAVLKKCHENGWIYKGTDVMPWCPRCSTALSQHEIVTEGYRDLTHPALTLKFPLREREKEFLLVWTTTPWTLTSNVAVAVHPDITYAKIRHKDEILYLAKATLKISFPDGGYETIEEVPGQEMNGWSYLGPYDELPLPKDAGALEAHRVILWEEVSEDEGTGIVHIAPGCGKEDFELGKKQKLPVVAPLNEFGVFIQGLDWLTGTHVYESVEPIVNNLAKKGFLFKVEDYTHRYPVCWRCDSELVFRLVDEWFISMGKKLDKPLEELTKNEKKENLRYQVMESAKQVRWIPDYGLQQELDWLQNMDDWMISKKRYWGLALPLWECSKCGNFEVVGSKEELKSRAIEGWKTFDGHSPHRPWIESIKLRCSRCGATTSRIPDVGNPWLDAGIVSYSTLNYRHDREYWEQWFPAALICESLPGQFRNWFYSMLVMSTILEGRTPFLSCFGYGLVLGEDGREMHKSWGNAVWFDEAVERMGADVMRWMFCTTRPETNLIWNWGDEVKRTFLIPLWNVYSFFVTYAPLDKWTPKDSSKEFSVLDKWILSRLQVLIADVTGCLENYDPFNAAKALGLFVDMLSTWYIRRSRRRFWKSEADSDKRAGYTTLYACLTTLVKLLAPFIPFVTEEIYQDLVRGMNPNAPESVHHEDWPESDKALLEEDLMKSMQIAITICELGRSARSKAGTKLRQPLSEVKVVASENVLASMAPLQDLIKEELNVKKLDLTSRMEDLMDYKVKALPEILGKKHGRLFPKISSTVASMDTNALASRLQSGLSIDLQVDGQTIKLLPEEVEISSVPKQGYFVVQGDQISVGLNITVTEQLKKEGLARDIVRRVQNQRKKAGFNIADHIELYYEAESSLAEALDAFVDYVETETLSVEIHKAKPPEGAHVEEYKIEGESLKIGIVRVSS